MRLLLISNSTNAGEEYLAYPMEEIRKFLGDQPREAIFIPYAAVTFSYDEYERKVNKKFQEIGHSVVSIHHDADPIKTLQNADAVVVGGGNTWHLLKTLQKQGLLESVRNAVRKGTPYIGWSAGSNLACPTIMTTNDMPIVEPESFEALRLIPFQINPHYLDANPQGHAGETRETRISEFIEVNPEVYVAGLREGTMLRLEDHRLNLIGPRSMKLFRKGMKPVELQPEDSLDFLLLPVKKS